MMTPDDLVLVADGDGVRTITLNRSAKANALTASMLERMAQAVRGAPTEGIGVIVLRSASPAVFSAGGDIREFSEGPEHLQRQGTQLRELMFDMARSPLPIIAAAGGAAAGAGVMVLAMTDILLASETLSFVCPEIHFHMYPVIVQAVLETRLTATQARQMCLSARPMTAESALARGWVTELFPAAHFEAAVNERLAYYLSRRDALRVARRSKLLTEPPEDFVRRVQAMEPLMHENFALPGVQERIGQYLLRLAAKEEN